jgi:hypothetical protein
MELIGAFGEEKRQKTATIYFRSDKIKEIINQHGAKKEPSAERDLSLFPEGFESRRSEQKAALENGVREKAQGWHGLA